MMQNLAIMRKMTRFSIKDNEWLHKTVATFCLLKNVENHKNFCKFSGNTKGEHT